MRIDRRWRVAEGRLAHGVGRCRGGRWRVAGAREKTPQVLTRQ